MGNPLSGILAEMALEHIINEAVNKLETKPTFIKKYVDDIICIIPDDTVNNTLNTFNTIHNKLKFTIEKEENRSIPFLDIKLIRTNNNKIITDWYCKPYSYNRILNYYSNHPHTTKINTIQTYTNKIIKLSNNKFLQNNIEKITNILTKNNYPMNIIKSTINKAIRNKHYKNTEHQNPDTIRLEDSTSIYNSIPYINKVSITIAKLIKENNNITKIAYKPINKLDKIYTKTKDQINKNDKNNVVYQVKCDNCNKTYIGQTSKKLNTRLNQHKTYIRKTAPHSALASHSIDTGHTFSFEETKIIDQDNKKLKREIKEACHIHINKNNAVNLRLDTQIINHDYKYILQIIK